MNPMLHLRKRLGLTQKEMADVAGVSQGTVCKWEKGQLKPDVGQLVPIRKRIRRSGIEWEDRWFFDKHVAPSEVAT